MNLLRRKTQEPTEEKEKTPSRKAGHRRVFTRSSQSFGNVEVKIINATDIPGKKSIQPYVQVFLGSTCFNTKKKKGNSAEWNEEFSSTIDRDDYVSYKVWDMGKLERADPGREVAALCKKRIPVKEFARRGNISKEQQAISLVGGGTLNVEFSFTVNPPVPGEIHTKTFSYPSWMADQYGVNQIPPDLDSIRTGWSTLARYTSRWLLSQRAVQAQMQRDDDSEEDSAPEEEEQSEIPEGLTFRLIDISSAAHDKVYQIVVTYTWFSEEKTEADDDDVLFARPKILTSKLFSVATYLNKKKQYDGKGHSQGGYTDVFNKVSEGSEEAIKLARDWTKENSGHEIFKLSPINTTQSHHVLLWYYK